eukprot:5666511-Prymnesium_polylepis.1
MEAATLTLEEAASVLEVAYGSKHNDVVRLRERIEELTGPVEVTPLETVDQNGAVVRLGQPLAAAAAYNLEGPESPKGDGKKGKKGKKDKKKK